MNALYYDNDMHAKKNFLFLCKCLLVFKCLSLSVKSRWWVTFLTDQGDVTFITFYEPGSHLWFKHYHKPMINDNEFH